MLSERPIPVQGISAEGGGLRAWGLARGLSANARGFEVVIAHPARGGADDRQRLDGVTIREWTWETLPDLVQAHESVVVSYCAGGLTPAVLDALRPDQQLVLDCNVPFHVEVSARHSQSLDHEYRDFVNTLPRVTRALRRGDLFLCASDRQKLYYQGVLAGVGRVNPATYGAELLHVVPYGMDGDEPIARQRPIDALTGRPKSARLLWFGSLYPWFQIQVLLDAVVALNDRGVDTTLTVVGARNPGTTHPDFLASFDAFDELVIQPRYRAHVFTQPWVDYKDRADWYMNADLGITISRDGLENMLAWRTRLVDMVWGRLPVATNGGDALGDDLISRGAALHLDVSDSRRLAEGLARAIAHPSALRDMRVRLEEVRPELAWSRVTATTAVAIGEHRLASDRAPRFAGLVQEIDGQSRRHNVVRLAGRLLRGVRQDGLVPTAKLVRAYLAERLRR